MRAELLKRYESMESIRNAIDAKIAGIDAAKLNQSPGDGRWSVVQVMSHLIKAETLSASYISRKVSEPATLKTAGIGEAFRSALIDIAMVVPLSFSAPGVVAEVPANEDPALVRERWVATRAGMKQLIESVPDALLDKTVYKHPVAGLMNLRQALSFMEAHSKRHAKQIDRALVAVR